jgi:hypothetical protein
VVLAMALSSVLAIVGCSSNNSSFSGSNITATPTLSPGAGTYKVSQPVTIGDTTQGAVLYCTTDGTTPTTSSPQCSQPTTVFKTEFLQAIAVAPGKSASAVASAGYTISPDATAAPAFNPAGGSYTGTQTVTISDGTVGASIYYTLDGSAPSANSTLYTGPVSISQTTTLSAIAVASGFADSPIVIATYTIQATLPAPTVSSIMPASANAGGAAFTLAVTGTNFISGSTVQWNGTGLATTYGSATQLTAAVPANLIASAGTANVTVFQASGISAAATFTINAVTPTITALNPSSGAAGTSVAITGTNFTGATAVNFGGTPATSFTVSSATSIAAVAPAGTGTANVTVITPTGTSVIVAADQFAYTSAVPTLTGISPATGPSAGGTSVTITGTNFTGATAVNFGSTPATNVTVVSATSITAVSPAGTGTVDVTVVTPSGTSATAAADQFIYSATAAGLTSVSPAIGPSAGGTSVTVTGSNFTGATAVNFGATPATSFTVNSATSITAVSPAGTGTVDITVVTPSGTSATTAADQFTYGVTFNGTVFSGALPIAGAKVQIYAAGITGYGAGSNALPTAPAVVTTDTGGNFSFAYACPASGAPGDQIYLVATGGDSGSGPNSSIALMAALGTCSRAPTSVKINEVTTVASAYALSAFATINSSGGIAVGAPGTGPSCNAASGWQSTGVETCNYTGLVHAFQAVNNLVNITTGTALTFTPAYKMDLAGDPNVVNNSTVPTTRINALADMLASCVESNGASCSGSTNLLGAATTTGTPTPGVPAPVTPMDTLQAALNIAQNPGNNVPNLLSLVSATPPYSLANPDTGTPLVLNSTGAPTDLTLALTFTGAGLGFYPPNVSLSDGNSGMFNGGLTIDAGGNIWVGAYLSGNPFLNAGILNGELLAEFNALGAPVTPSMQLSSDSPQRPTYGGFNPQPNLDPSGAGISLLAVDPSGNIWTNNGASLGSGSEQDDYLLEISTSPTLSLSNSYFFNSGAPASLAIDGNGNAWYLSTVPNLQEVLANGIAGGVTGGTIRTINGGAQHLTLDSNGGIWVAGPNASFSGTDVVQISPSDGSVIYDAFSTSSSGGSAPTTLAADGTGNIYGCDPTGLNLDVFNAQAKTAPSNLLVNSYQISTQRSCGSQLVLDGQGHLFAVLDSGNGAPLNYKLNANIDEYTTGGVLISPSANGYTGSSSAEGPTLSFDTNYSFATPGVSAAIDGSGNLWVLNTDVYGTNSSFTATIPGNALVEYIGIGAPVVTPTSSALFYGSLGARP